MNTYFVPKIILVSIFKREATCERAGWSMTIRSRVIERMILSLSF